MILLAMGWAEGTEGDAEKRCEPFFAQMRSAFTGRPSLEDPKPLNPVPGIREARLTGDTGVSNIVLAGAMYSGVIWTLQYEELFDVSFVE